MEPPKPIALPNDIDAPLPEYLARHINLGYNDDDIAAFLSSIESSQRRQVEDDEGDEDQLPHLPAEIVLMIIDCVRIDYILDFRLVSRGVKEYIDTRVMRDYLRRTQIIGTGDTSNFQPDQYPDTYKNTWILRAHFDRLEFDHNSDEQHILGGEELATFYYEDDWLKQVHGIPRGPIQSDTFHDLVYDIAPFQPYRGLRSMDLGWCIQLDHAVMDLLFSHPARKYEVKIFEAHDSDQPGIKIKNWKAMIVQFLSVERAIRRKMEETRMSQYTFSHTEDSIRHVRRHQILRNLDPEKDRRTKWALRLLTPLWGKPSEFEFLHPGVGQAEQQSSYLLLLLRKEAAMTSEEHQHLKQLAIDMHQMNANMEGMLELFDEWGDNFARCRPQTLTWNESKFRPPKLNNPMEWGSQEVVEVEKLVGRWKTQRKVIEQVRDLLFCSNDAMRTPEDAFDSTPNDI